ncbi:unnamed protein product [Arabidopsis lyrata]|uniref:receptor like protein 30-like n=1 Tax=Arabidopsis lyrata subsp. lyrata TaxID=81972 RepID=UPI000A29C61F|nr:receptor like protein 30-like [Arabidopsis lyrata subsp. lyrata]CAH8262065.1 unnamed protein product [Arabidopsis lyrata]|eukprot:XP_020887913.1 receptor like protein 30-like [Arabidopsis lyrata subsp. lyrata]
MMVQSHCYCYFFCLISLLLHTLASPKLHHCHHDQRDALLEFKDEFPTLQYNAKVNGRSLSSWNKTSDCCSWEEVTCDTKSGKVISLVLDFFYLNNSLKTNSSLFKLQHLRILSLSGCKLYGEVPSSLGNLSHLTDLVLPHNKLVGQFPASVGNLTQLTRLELSDNNFSGMLPHDMSGYQNLDYFDVRENSFSGPFPTSLFKIPSLDFVLLGSNHFKGPMDFGNASSTSRLYYLSLSYNQFNGPIPDSTCEFPHLGDLDLKYNNFIGSIPRCISKLDRLIDIDFSNNKLEGEVPGCLRRLTSVRLSHNSFSSFGKSWEVLNDEFTLMWILDLNSNSFRGQVPNWICKISLLLLLDFSNNSFNGSIPTCLKNCRHLKALILRNNSLSGTLPEIFVNATMLLSLDVSGNQLEGKFPKSLVSCESLEYLNVEENRIKDKFPFWLTSLPRLSVLSLRSNEFYGPLYHLNVSIGFQSLRVIDISLNDFSGTLPPFYFQNWRKMINASVGEDNIFEPYMDIPLDLLSYSNSMEMVQKGTNRKFERIRRDFRAIDFSKNRFCGEIPGSIGLLKELRLLNLSGNAFTSGIPQSLANLTKLEELDLSQNQLSGQIPRDLGSLSFLSTMNFSHNNLEGSVPRGTQFQSQNCSSFMDNPKLYGLEEICGKIHVPNQAPQESEELSETEEQEINWIAAAIAYGPGLFCGLVIGHIFVTHNYEWFMEKCY